MESVRTLNIQIPDRLAPRVCPASTAPSLGLGSVSRRPSTVVFPFLAVPALEKAPRRVPLPNQRQAPRRGLSLRRLLITELPDSINEKRLHLQKQTGPQAGQAGLGFVNAFGIGHGVLIQANEQEKNDCLRPTVSHARHLFDPASGSGVES